MVVATHTPDIFLAVYEGNEYTILRMLTTNSLMAVTLMNLMSHPNIIKPLEYLSSPDKMYIYVVTNSSHTTLMDIIHGPNPLDEIDVRIIAKQLLSAVDYMYRNRIIHRGLDPRIIATDGISLRIMDMSKAWFIPTRSKRPLRPSVPDAYSAPELYAGRNTPVASDVWSVGIILLECMYRLSIMNGVISMDAKQWASDPTNDMRPYIDALSVSSEAKQCLHAMLRMEHRQRLFPSQLLTMPWFHDVPYQNPEVISYTTHASLGANVILTIDMAQYTKDSEIAEYAAALVQKISKKSGQYRRDMNATILNIAVLALDGSKYSHTSTDPVMTFEAFSLLDYDIILI